MKINKEIIKLGITLMIITMVATVALSLTNEVTKDRIEEQSEIQLLFSLAQVMPEADDFKEMEDYYNAYSNGGLIGRVLKVNAPGYSSTIQLLAGVNLENRITKVVVLNQVETPGLGANVEKNEFLDQFIGKTKEGMKIKKDDGEIDAVTGATISSRAVTDGIRGMLEKYLESGGTSTTSKAVETKGDGSEIKSDSVIEEVESNEGEGANTPTGAAVYVEYLNKKLAKNEAE